MFFNQEQYRENELKQSQTRANYFRSYNQLPHRKLYLKQYSHLRRLLSKYNPLHQDQRKGDRHKLNRKNRYQLSILTQEFSKRGWEISNNIKNLANPSKLPFLIFNVALVDKKLPLTSYSYKSLLFLYACEGASKKQKEEAYLFAYLIRKEGKELRKLLAEKPLKFRKRLEEIEKSIQVVGQHWKKQDIIRTVNQVPQEKGWQLDSYYQEQDLSALLLKNKEAGGKNKLVLDFDHYGKDSEGNYLFSEEQRGEVDKVIDYLINYWKLPWYEVSKSGGRKLHLNIDELPAKSKLWWKLLVVGDILGKGSQTTLPLSEKRKVEFSKWSGGGKVLDLPQIKLENWEGDLAKFSLGNCDKRAMMRRSFEEIAHSAKREQSDFLSTNTTTKKKLGYYGEKVVKPLKIFAPQYVERLGEKGGSRESAYYWVGYRDEMGKVEGFLVDRGWREGEFNKVMNGVSSICLRVGTYYDFLLRV